MKRILFDVPRWNIYLHRRERKMPLVSKTDHALTCIQDEIFDRLFEGEAPRLNEYQKEKRFKTALPWAENVHEMCDKLGIQDVAKECKHKATQAALATAWIMEMIAPDIAQQKPQQSSAAQGQAADQAHGLEHMAKGPGNQNGESEEVHVKYNPEDEKRIEEVAEIIKDDARLKKIALLAGKFKRVVLSKQKTKVRHAQDEITEIEQGGEISRLLPSELVKFVSPKMNTLIKADLMERKCMQYSMQGSEELGKGPMILCLDKSSSMAEGDKDIWATAIALALLDMAHRQKRTFILLGFDTVVFQKCIVRVGHKIPKEHLCVAPRGGTDIATVLGLVCQGVETRKVMEKADVVLITDGKSDTSEAEYLKERLKSKGVTIMGIGIGTQPETILPWCDEVHSVTDMGGLEDKVADALFKK